MENPFVPRYGHDQEPHASQIAFEGQRVRLVLDRFGLGHHAPAMVARFEQKRGRRWLSFETFFEFFPTFPVLLEGHWFYQVGRRCRPAALFRSFEETFLVRRYLDVHARGREEAKGRPTGMVFNFDGYENGMVMHDGAFDTGGVKMVCPLPGDTPPHRVTVEPFLGLLDHLAAGGWTPATPLPERPRPRKARRAVGISPWIVRLLGCGPDAVVLDFLMKVLRSKCGRDRLLIRVHDVERQVAIDRHGLACRTGLSERQVKRAVEALCSGGFIATKRRDAGGRVMTHFRPDRDALRRARSGLGATR